MKPGLYVYHCATPTVAQHIANGMYGMILVEPEGGLPKVDKEFYVMQGELYTEESIGTQGELTESYERLIDELPTHYVFNGKVGGLIKGTVTGVSPQFVRKAEDSEQLDSILVSFEVDKEKLKEVMDWILDSPPPPLYLSCI